MLDTIINLIKSNNPEMAQINSLSVHNWNTLFENEEFSKFIPYEAFNNDTKVFHNNDETVSFMIEIATPFTRSSGATAVVMSELLSKLPEDTYLSTFYYGSKNHEDTLVRFKDEHSIRSSMDSSYQYITESVDEICNFFRKKTAEACSSDMLVKIKNNRVFICANTHKRNMEALKDYMVDVANILSSNNLSPVIFEAAELHRLVYEILNPQIKNERYAEYDKTVPLNRQVVSKESLFYVDDDYVALSDEKYWINSTIQSISEHVHIYDFGQKLGDYISSSLNSNQFNDEFIINATVRRKSSSDARKISKIHAVTATQSWGEIFRKFVNVKKESLDIVDRIDERNESLFEYDMDVLVAGNSLDSAKKNYQTIESYWMKANNEGRTKIKLEKTKGIHHLAFLSALPMAMNDEYFVRLGGKARTLFMNQVSHLFPLEVDSKGDGTNILMPTRRGMLAGIDLYRSSTNFNAFLVATSGAGKSVFLNMLGYLSFARGDKVFVLDYDNSFTGVIEAVNGQYLNLDPSEGAISFNPFSEISSREDMLEELPYLSSFLYLLGSSKNEERAEEDEKLIKTEMQQIILSQYDKLREKLEITHIRDVILSELGNDQRFSDFSRQLGQYCRNGIYEKWFSGKCEFTMEKDMMAVEFKGVENHEDLRDPLVMLLLYHIGKIMYSTNPNKPRIQIILDEAHRFLGKNKKMDDFIEQAYRRARKFNGSMIIATQGFDDIYSADGGLSRAGKTIVNNSAWKFIMKQTEVSTNLMIQSNVFSFNDLDKQILKSIKTVKPQYSEIFCMTSDDNKIPLRLLMPKSFYYMTTTDSKDKKKISEYQEKYKCGKVAAIKKLLEDIDEHAVVS